MSETMEGASPEEAKAEELAAEIVRDLDLLGYVRRWNTGELDTSLLSSFEAYYTSHIYDPDLWARYDAAVDRARAGGFGEAFQVEMRRQVTQPIVASFVTGLITMLSAWARDAWDQDEHVPDIGNIGSFTDALLATVEAPVLAGPTGELLFNEGEVRILLIQALTAEIGLRLLSERSRT